MGHNRIDAQRLRELFCYEPRTGVLTWRMDGPSKKAGAVAGSVNQQGYVMVRVDGRRVGAHRVVWALHYGEIPAFQIDHVNRQRNDNRIANLRESSAVHNMGNTKLNSRNTSGFRGVGRSHADRSKWTAYIKIDGKQRRLGTFSTAVEASAAYESAAQEKYKEHYRAP